MNRMLLIAGVGVLGIGAFFVWRRMKGSASDYTTATPNAVAADGTPVDLKTPEGREKHAVAYVESNTAKIAVAESGAAKTATAATLASVIAEYEKTLKVTRNWAAGIPSAKASIEAVIKGGVRAITAAYNDAEAKVPGSGLAAARARAASSLLSEAKAAKDALAFTANMTKDPTTGLTPMQAKQIARCRTLPKEKWVGLDAGCEKLLAMAAKAPVAGLSSFAFNRGSDLSGHAFGQSYAGGGILGLRGR